MESLAETPTAGSEPPRPRLIWLLLHPVSLLAGTITVAVIALVAFAVFGLDKGRVLERLAEYDFARGLITYIFGVGTVGLSVVLVVGALLGGEEMKERFNRAKEILALLLGIFGTMVGFYYGSELAAQTKRDRTPRFAVTGLEVSPSAVEAGGVLAVAAHIEGGRTPVRWSLGLDVGNDERVRALPAAGTLVEQVAVPSTAIPGVHELRLVVWDVAGDTIRTTRSVTVTSRPTKGTAERKN